MASLVTGFDYDVFVSYRLKDDKYDKWITTFVDHLRTELESTFRDEISIYFDNNRIDGLLPNHDIEGSLQSKLTCLVFIPVISHTYCDEASYAWAHEFRTFVEQASSDSIGLKVRLANGNYASRVLPVIIHDLQQDERILCERILGSQLRGIEFIYREPGVNRPLRPDEDNPKDNLNHTTYRNQINKMANAIKEILSAIKAGDLRKVPDSSIQEKVNSVSSGKKFRYSRILVGAFILVTLIIAGYIFYSSKLSPEEISIAVLPFDDQSVIAEKGFAVGVMREVWYSLSEINGISIPGRTATEKYEDATLSDVEIARELKVTYLLDGEVVRDADMVQVTVNLVDGKTGVTKWTNVTDTLYNSMNMIGLHRKIARKLASSLDLAIRSSFRNRKPFDISNEAYDLYLRTPSISPALTYNEVRESISSFESVIKMAPSFAPAYVELAFYWIYEGAGNGDKSREEVLKNAEPLISTALELDKNYYRAHIANALMSLFYYQDFKSVEKEFRRINKLSLASKEEIAWFSDYLHAMGKHKKAFLAESDAFEINSTVVQRWAAMALAYFYKGDMEKAQSTLDQAWKHFPESGYLFLNQLRILIYSGDYQEAITLVNKISTLDDRFELNSFTTALLGIASYKTGDEINAKESLQELLMRSEKSSVQSPSFFAAALYAAMDDKDSAFRMLEKSRENKEVELYWLKVDPMFNTLHKDPRFKKLIKVIGF